MGPPEDELDSLGRSLDNMAARIDGLLKRGRCHQLSHELRTPIARMRVLAELMEDRPHPTRHTTSGGRFPLQEDVVEIAWCRTC